MKNSEMPAMPVLDAADSGGALPFSALGRADCCGLTKREYFAGLAMQGMCSEIIAGMDYADVSPEQTAKDAVAMADALLQQLQATEGGE